MHLVYNTSFTQVDSGILKRFGSKVKGGEGKKGGAEPNIQGVSSTKLQNSWDPRNNLQVTILIKYILIK